MSVGMETFVFYYISRDKANADYEMLFHFSAVPLSNGHNATSNPILIEGKFSFSIIRYLPIITSMEMACNMYDFVMLFQRWTILTSPRFNSMMRI